MWEAIERLQQGESLNIQDVKTNLFWEFRKFTSHDGETMESYYTRFYKLINEMIQNNLIVNTMQVIVQFLQQLQPKWSRFVTIVKQQHKLDEVSYHKLFDILKQYHNEVNELHAKILARNANLLALVATAQADQDQYYQTSRHKGKEIAKPITPPSETASEEDSDPKQAQRDKDMVKDSAYHKEKMLLCKQAEQGVPLQAEQYDWLADTDEEVDEQELEAHYSYMAKIQEVPTADSGNDSEPVEQVQNVVGYNVFANDFQYSKQSESVSNTCLVETDDRNVSPDSPDMCEDDIQNDQTDEESDDELVKERHDELMKQSLLTKSRYEGLVKQRTKVITDLKLREEHDIEKMLSMEKQLKFLNEIVYKRSQSIQTIHMMTPKNIYKNVRFLPVSKSIIKSRQAYNVMTKNTNHFKEIIDNAWIKHSKDQFCAPTAQDMAIQIQTCLMPLAIKTQNDSFKFVHELKQEMHADLKYVESLEKEIDELESDKAKFSDMYEEILQECVSKDVMCSYLIYLSDLYALDELQCLYLHKVKHDTFCNEKASNIFRKEREQYFKIQDLKAQMQDKNIAISELKKLIEKGKGKYVDTKFDKPSVVRQPNAQRIPKPSVLGKPAPFSDSLERRYFPKTKSVPKTNVSEGLSKPVTAQALPQTEKKAVSNTNVLKLGMYRINNRVAHTRVPQLPQTVRNTNPHVSTSTEVNHNTNVSRPRLKSNQSRDKVLPKNSQVKVKKTQVEVHPRISSVSNKMKSVTACKDCLNSRTLNANDVCATCKKCLIDSNHFACVTKMLNDVHARTKKPTIVPISTRKPKSQANKLVATHQKKQVASKWWIE
nr:hypothetical protein [Tanacetum cinerariifolium]